MRVWRYYWQDPDEGRQQGWAASERAARHDLARVLKVMTSNYPDYPQDVLDGEPKGVERVEIPIDKTGLIRWLNTNFTSDN